jgi:hypothetical protein
MQVVKDQRYCVAYLFLLYGKTLLANVSRGKAEHYCRSSKCAAADLNGCHLTFFG